MNRVDELRVSEKFMPTQYEVNWEKLESNPEINNLRETYPALSVGLSYPTEPGQAVCFSKGWNGPTDTNVLRALLRKPNNYWQVVQVSY